MSKELEALKRIRQETCPATYMADFDKNECCDVIERALQRLEAIDNANPSEALRYVNGKIADLEDDLQHYTMVDKDKCREFFIREDLKQFTSIKNALLKQQEQKQLKELKIKYKG